MRFYRLIQCLMVVLVVSSCASYELASGSGCFAKGTKILSPSGPVAIETLASGNEVYAWDEPTNQVVIGVVEQLVTRENSETWTVSLGNGRSLEITSDHPLYDAKSKIWKPFAEFKIGDSLKYFDDDSQTLIDVDISALGKSSVRQTTYNLKVRRYENSFAEGVLAHFY